MTTTSQHVPRSADPAEPSLPLSVLERGGHPAGTTAEQAVRDVVDTARTADAHGYRRFWVAEHHAVRTSASSTPAVLIAHIAARTERIRVGSGGVMLPNHPPYTVAEQFATLGTLHPGRIDLGVGRPSDGSTEAHRLLEEALRRAPRAGTGFPAQIDELLGVLFGRGPDRNRFHSLPLTPRPATAPEVHVLGAGTTSARLAAERGLPFVYGHHLSRAICRPEAPEGYRAAFRPDLDHPGQDGTRPHLSVSVHVVCAETDELAESLALRSAAYMAAHSGNAASSGPLSPARAEHLARRVLDEYQVVYGAPAKVAAELEALAARFAADELMVAPFEATGKARARTLRLAARARVAPPARVTQPARVASPAHRAAKR
ncbi:MsnO8 family LLM class oxidoreductase [Streptomyces sp. NPDC002701]|uniref:MsnO8 family LLM class oxidoreductase n=1 Tax=Streptomyces sp. NPDC002701 TaxID=3364661 RepID=UPI0036C80CC6